VAELGTMTVSTTTEIERIFALQRANQWKMKATSAEDRKAMLRKLKAAVDAR
jgi:aldehyde dehydrogenase (NAD+)